LQRTLNLIQHKEEKKMLSIWKRTDILWMVAGIMAVGIFGGIALCCWAYLAF